LVVVIKMKTNLGGGDSSRPSMDHPMMNLGGENTHYAEA
jgi:hypothetical protein